MVTAAAAAARVAARGIHWRPAAINRGLRRASAAAFPVSQACIHAFRSAMQSLYAFVCVQ